MPERAKQPQPVLKDRFTRTHWLGYPSSAVRIIRFTTADNVGHALTTRINSGSVSATDITRSQLFSTTSVATICATTFRKPLFSRCLHRSTEPRAEARIDGDSVVCSHPDVKEPVAIRYGFCMNPAVAKLYNRDGLPASLFQTDEWLAKPVT